MPPSTTSLMNLGAEQLRARHEEIRRQYQAFAERKLKLNLTRGKPSSRPLDLCNELLSLPGRGFMSGGVDSRNYGELQGLAELRGQMAPILGVSADRVILGDNASLALMHDAVELTPAGATRPFGKDPHDRVIRIAPSFPELPEVTQAAAGVAVCALRAATEKLLQSHAC